MKKNIELIEHAQKEDARIDIYKKFTFEDGKERESLIYPCFKIIEFNKKENELLGFTIQDSMPYTRHSILTSINIRGISKIEIPALE